VKLHIDFSTPAMTLHALETAIRDRILTRLSFEFYPNFAVQLVDVENTNRLVVEVTVRQRSNWQDSAPSNARTKLILVLKEVCEVLKISYTPCIQPVRLVDSAPML